MNYHNILHEDMLNGDGIRVTLFVSGCSLHCPQCQNPQTWDKNSGIPFDQAAKEEIFIELSKPYISGLTITGGHPFEHYNIETIFELCKEIKEKFPNKTIWVYTGFDFGYVSSFGEILDYIDVIIDGRYVDSLRDTSLKWRGSSNQHVIDVRETMQSGQIVLHCD